MQPAGNDFQDLLDRARRGDRAAMGELLSQYESPLRRVVRVHLGPALRPYADSLDLVQSAQKSLMLALWSHRYEFSSPDKLLALATTILKRKVARLAERTQYQQQLSPGADATGLPEPLANLTSRESDPVELAAMHDTLELIRGQLTDLEQNMLTLTLQGCSRQEVAEQLGCEANVFRAHWSRLTRRLRKSGLLEGWV